MPERWSDEKLQKLDAELRAHILGEEKLRQQSEDLHEAIFRREDKEGGITPGLMQLVARMDARLEVIEGNNKRQKTFIGGVVFAVSGVWFVLTDPFHKLLAILKSL